MEKELYQHIDMINEIMDNFDFHRVEDVMHHLHWEWADNDSMYVPDETAIRKFARTLICEAIKQHSTIESGGFAAIYYGNDDGTFDIRLDFIVTSWATF